MKTISIICALMLANVYNAAAASASDSIVRKLQQSVENDLICESYGVSEKEYRQLAKKAGMKILIFRPGKSEEYIGYEGLFIKGKKTIKIFGFDLMAIYFEPENFHFLALLSADEERLFDVIKLAYPSEYSKALAVKYNDNYGVDTHTGKHMNNGGNNSSRTIVPIRKVGFSSLSKWSIEVESCSQTKSKWYSSICNMFEQKPLTWMGCAIVNDLYPCEKGDINCIKRKLME